MMKKKLLLLFAVLATAINASADNTVIYYTSSDGQVVTPTASDAFKDADGKAVTFTNKYADGQGTLTFDGIVTEIGEEAFRYCYSLTSVEIPNSVTSIGGYAFYSTALTSVTIPSSVTSIGDHAFSGCPILTSVKIPSSVTSIGDHAFSSCISLKSVEIPTSVTSIGESAFTSCSSLESFSGKFASEDHRFLIVDGVLNSFAPAELTNYEIPNSVTSIGKYAFANCPILTSVKIPNSITSIGERAFYCSLSLTSVEIPNSVTSIGDYVFHSCSSLTSVKIGNSVTSIGKEAFSYCSRLASVVIGNSVTMIGTSAFSYCSSLTSVEIPNSVTDIGGWAFSYCSNLTSVTIPNSVNVIMYYLFYDCTSLTSVVIPSSVTVIGSSAFSRCSNLKEITSLAVTPPLVSYSNTFGGVSKEECVLNVPEESVEAYKAADFWKDFLNVEVTGISIPSVNNLSTSGKAYNLSGTAVNDGYRGIVIQNGKKLLRK